MSNTFKKMYFKTTTIMIFCECCKNKNPPSTRNALQWLAALCKHTFFLVQANNNKMSKKPKFKPVGIQLADINKLNEEEKKAQGEAAAKVYVFEAFLFFFSDQKVVAGHMTTF